jgi:CRISPR-associated protein Csx16
MRALAGLYLQFERYPEVAVVVREALVSKYAEKRVEGVEVNSSAFSSAERSNAERHWQCADPDASRSIADIRNDIEHAGFREQPMGGEKLKDRVSDMLEKLGELSVDMAAQPHGKTVLVTRHAGARDWVEQEGHQVDDLIVHLDPEIVQKGDKVIGTLPINLINEVCERGARYFHLTLELQAEHRGRELTAEDMRRCGARLMEYRVQGVTDK